MADEDIKAFDKEFAKAALGEGMAFKTVHQFPEGPRSSHGADEEGKASYIKSSKHAKHGHTDHGDRMPHPFGEEPPMSESGEGKGSK